MGAETVSSKGLVGETLFGQTGSRAWASRRAERFGPAFALRDPHPNSGGPSGPTSRRIANVQYSRSFTISFARPSEQSSGCHRGGCRSASRLTLRSPPMKSSVVDFPKASTSSLASFAVREIFLIGDERELTRLAQIRVAEVAQNKPAGNRRPVRRRR